MLLDMVMSSCGKYIITCDRDEKIRVSKYPNAYNIECYCLGHTDFVNNLQVVHNFSENILLSASGDGSLRVWKYLEGKEVRPNRYKLIFGWTAAAMSPFRYIV